MVKGESSALHQHVESGVQSIQGSIKWKQAAPEERHLLHYSAEGLRYLRANRAVAQETLPAS